MTPDRAFRQLQAQSPESDRVVGGNDALLHAQHLDQLGWIDGDESAFGNCGGLGEAGIMCRQIGDRDEAVARPTSAIPVQRQLFRQPLLQGREHPLRAAPTFG